MESNLTRGLRRENAKVLRGRGNGMKWLEKEVFLKVAPIHVV